MTLVINGKQVPENYQQLYFKAIGTWHMSHMPALSLPLHLHVEGERRYENGKEEYLVDSEYGKVNACYLPSTDTPQDIREELLDAYFNTMVYVWKHPEVKEACQLMKSIVSCLKLLEDIDKIGSSGTETANTV